MATSMRAPKRASLALLLTACLTLPTAGIVQGQGAKAPVTITVDGCWTNKDQDAAFQKIAAGFNKSQSGVVVKAGEQGSSAKIVTQVSAGDAPDIYFDCSSADVGEWAANGYILNLDPYIQSGHFDLSKLNRGAHQIGTFQGHTYALPFLEDTFMILYNKTLFKAAGLDPNKPPTTAEELAADSDKLTKKDSNGNITQLGFSPLYNAGAFDGTWLPVFATTFGGTLADSTGTKITANCPACIAALTWETGFYTRYGASAVDKFLASSGAGDLFDHGKLAMAINGEWQPFFIATDAPKGFDYGVAPLPHPANRPDLANYGMVGGNPGTIMKGSKNPDAAWKFLSYVEGLGPTMSFAYTMENVPQLIAGENSPKLNPEPHYRVFVKYAQGPHIAAFPVSPVSSDFASELASAEQLVLHGKTTAKAGLDKVTSDMQSKLSSGI
jgi:multiple sugar transport system substrate-binding protein